MSKPIPWTTKDLIAATQGELLCGNKMHTFEGVSIDSRNISTRDLFVAIKGENHDGHSFIMAMATQGIKGFIVQKSHSHTIPIDKWDEAQIVCIAVANTIKSLGKLAAFQQKRAGVSVVAITGSNGKTTTRGMTSAVMEQQFHTLSTSGNLNNEIGLPLTLLKLDTMHEWAVLELGMNSPGEIGRLSKICNPGIGVITNIGPAHIEGVGSIEGVMKAKGELIGNIKENGTAVLNADDPMTQHLAKETLKNKLLFGLNPKATIRAENILQKDRGSTFMLKLPGVTISIDLKAPGSFMILNALAAASVGYLLGVTAEKIKKGLEKFEPIQGRMNLFDTKQDLHIIDDTYNANPASMKAAIETLVSLKKEKRGFLIAGDMFELGKDAENLHRKIGELTAKSNIERLYVAGKFAKVVAAGALSENMKPQDIITGTKEEIITDLQKKVAPGDWILVKGSRAMGMEKIVQELKNGKPK